jgi:hypothetical protein
MATLAAWLSPAGLSTAAAVLLGIAYLCMLLKPRGDG